MAIYDSIKHTSLSPKQVAVVILNYNGKDFLEKFLGSVVENSPEADLFIIDNGSDDQSVEMVTKEFPAIEIIALDKNYGYAQGYNKGLAGLDYPYFLLLNSDVEVSAGWIPPLLKLAESDDKIAAAQPKILDYNRKTHFEYAGAAGGFLDVLGYAFCRGRIFDALEEDKGQYNRSTDIFWATGACFLIKADVFKEMGGFDIRFFAHMEEIDLCWRMHNEGYRVVYQPDSKVYHVGGGTLPVENPFKTYLNFRNNLAMLLKNLPAGFLFPVIFFRMSLDGISGLRYFMRGDLKNTFSIIRAHFAFYSWIPYLLRNRARKFEGFKNLCSTAVVWQFFIKKKKTFDEVCLK